MARISLISGIFRGFSIIRYDIIFGNLLRDFWFGHKPQSQYAYLNLLVMLLPGLFAMGGLISLSESGFPSWPIVAFFLFLFSIWIYLQFRALKKSPEYIKISKYETVLELPKLVYEEIWFLLFLFVFGAIANLTSSPSSKEWMDIFAGLFLFLSTTVSIIPVNVFLRVYTENKKRVDLENQLLEQAPQASRENASGACSLIILVSVLVAFLVGKLSNKK